LVKNADYLGKCTEKDDTGQIGCLADVDDCSLGYAGREASRTYPGMGGNPPLVVAKALGVNNIKPFPDANLTDLLTGSGTIYPLARRLYLATGPAGRNFQTLPGQANPPTTGEAMLAKCFSQDSLVGAAINTNGYLAIPATNGGVQCLDYDQTKGTSSPPVNTPGAGNVALNLVSLDAKTSIFSVIGEDESGKELDKMLADSGIDTSYIICSRTRKTTNKTRVFLAPHRLADTVFLQCDSVFEGR